MLLHPTSLPGGRLDRAALDFLDFLDAAGCRVWQMLPLGPTGDQLSPYSPVSAYAGNPRLVPARNKALTRREHRRFAAFVEREEPWLADYALFCALKDAHGGTPWWDWPERIRWREPGMLRQLAREHRQRIGAHQLTQFHFAEAWRRIRQHAQQRSILLYGDLPMFVVGDSADVWANPQFFKLANDGRAEITAGVPPDFFAEDGQFWGNPVYDWDALRADGYRWWCNRVCHELRRFDLLRWDHFRALAATWEIPAGASSARDGAWHDVPGKELLETLSHRLGSLPFVAENLGTITAAVEQLRHEFELPGMHVLQFAFDGSPDNPHLPANHEANGVVYTGTHDNDTTLGWFQSLPPDAQAEVLAQTGGGAHEMPWPVIRATLDSRSRLAVIPLQDYLGLDSRHRMNRPGTVEGNWRWRLNRGEPGARVANRIRAALDTASRRAP